MMREYEIRIDILQIINQSRLSQSTAANDIFVNTIRDFSVYVKNLYLDMIESAIYSNRYEGHWEPIEDENYLKYIGTVPTSHIFDLIKDALEIREIKNDLIIRIRPDYYYPGSKLLLVSVLKAIDNGTSKFNARPMLKSIVRKLNSQIPSLWKSFLLLKGVLE